MNPLDLERFHAADELAFAEIIASVTPALRRQIIKYVGADRDLADDLYSEVCERIFDRRRDYRGDGPVAAWVFQLCARICIDYLRKEARAKRRTRPFDTPLGIAIDSRLEDERVRDAERLQSRLERVTDAVVALPPRMRAVALSHWYCGHPAAHIAREFGLTAPTVWTTLSKARTLLRGRLEPLVRTPSRTPT
jgi:RNA polymerase sigma factor (sigma-70 family)